MTSRQILKNWVNGIAILIISLDLFASFNLDKPQHYVQHIRVQNQINRQRKTGVFYSLFYLSSPFTIQTFVCILFKWGIVQQFVEFNATWPHHRKDFVAHNQRITVNLCLLPLWPKVLSVFFSSTKILLFNRNTFLCFVFISNNFF